MARKNKDFRPSARRPATSGELLDGVFRWLKLEEPARAYRALRAFSWAAGPRINARARAERVRGAILYVRVTSSAWSQELHILKEQLVAKLRRTPGGESIQDIRFTVGPLEELPDWDAQFRAEEPPPLPKPEVPLASEMQRAVNEIEDPELRADLTRLLEREPARRRPPSGS